MGVRSFVAACLQLNVGADMRVNIDEACRLIRQAREQGADMVFLPENAVMMAWGRQALLQEAYGESEHPGLVAFRQLAKDLGLWLHCGTVHVRQENGRLANRTLVFNPEGDRVARYDKIHMFDVNLPDGESYHESDVFDAGRNAVVLDVPWGRLGLSVCYDVRFPSLYRALAKAGAEVLVIPAAFTRTTGKAHWHILQRARAIENGCFVLAPAQSGEHPGGRQTFGHALVIDPWGTVVADAGEEPGIIMARLDLSLVGEVRARIPSLEHDRAFSVVSSHDLA